MVLKSASPPNGPVEPSAVLLNLMARIVKGEEDLAYNKVRHN